MLQRVSDTAFLAVDAECEELIDLVELRYRMARVTRGDLIHRIRGLYSFLQGTSQVLNRDEARGLEREHGDLATGCISYYRELCSLLS